MSASLKSTTDITAWQHHIEQWKQSKLSQAAYCREHQLNENQLSYYKRKFAGTLPTKQPHNNTTVQPSGFVQVKITPDIQRPEPLTLHFANGAHLAGITADNVPVVAQLAKALS